MKDNASEATQGLTKAGYDYMLGYLFNSAPDAVIEARAAWDARKNNRS